jgi:dynein heavy chain
MRCGGSGTTLEQTLSLNVEQHLSRLESISETASREFSLERALIKMQGEWQEVVRLALSLSLSRALSILVRPSLTARDQAFGIVPYRETGTSVLQSVDDIQALLDDHIVKTQTMLGSPFIGPFEGPTRAWEQKLRVAQEIIDLWLKVQSTWMYLEPIFGSADIMRQMPTEGRLFQTVDRTFRSTMEASAKVPSTAELQCRGWLMR